MTAWQSRARIAYVMPDRYVNLVLQQALQHSLKAQINGLKMKSANFR